MKRSRRIAVPLGWAQIVVGIVCVPFFVFPFSTTVRLVVLGLLSAVTQIGTGLGALFAAWAARDTDKLTGGE